MSPPLSENCGLCRPLKSIHRKNEYIIKEMRMGASWLISSYTEGLLILQQQEGVSKVTDTLSLLITQ